MPLSLIHCAKRAAALSALQWKVRGQCLVSLLFVRHLFRIGTLSSLILYTVSLIGLSSAQNLNFELWTFTVYHDWMHCLIQPLKIKLAFVHCIYVNDNCLCIYNDKRSKCFVVLLLFTCILSCLVMLTAKKCLLILILFSFFKGWGTC